MRPLPALLLLAVLPAAAGTDPKPKPADYPRSSTQPAFTLAAEFLAHSLLTPKGALFLRNYLVVEVALYPAPGARLKLSHQDFRLRTGSKKPDLLAQAPALVVSALRHPDWESSHQSVATVGLGDGSIMVGRPAPQERFPGDPNSRTAPPLPRAPDSGTPGVDADAKPEDE
jgi:hypothetical protein